MNVDANTALESLKDLEGIVGSFLIDPSGNIVAQDVPSYFGSATYDIAPRALRLREALSISEGELSSCVLRFGAHKLSFRPVGESLLGVLATAQVNMPALRMATNLVTRKLAKVKLDQPEKPSVPPPPTMRPPPVAAKANPGAAAPEAPDGRSPRKRAIYFRGKRVQ